MVLSHTWYCTNKWTVICYTPGAHCILRHSGRPDTLLHRLTECAHGTEIWGVDTAPNGNDTTRRSEVYSKWLAPNAVFPFLAPTTTASNIVDRSPLCLIQNVRAATTNTNGLRRLYAALAMEGTYVHLTSAKSGELPRHTLDAKELQGLHEGATRYKADECQSGLAPTHRWVTGNTEYPDSNLTRSQRWVQIIPDHEL